MGLEPTQHCEESGALRLIVASRSGQDIGHWTNRKLLSWAEGGFVVNKSVCCDSKAIPDIISQDLAKLRAFRKIEPQITVIPSIEGK
ncbi:hypothetical protein C0J52_14139 [Blattella germanica]|nr:hypothetical protein C0J52_14139 [Blattella germanica]